MATVVAGAGIVGEFGAERRWEGGVFVEEGVSAIAIAKGKRGGCDVLGDPVRIAGLAVKSGEVRGGGGEIGDRAWEAVLEDAGW